MPAANNDINWDFIVDCIKTEKCILFVGPETPLTLSGVPLYHALVNHIQADGKEVVYHPEDDFFYFRDEGAKSLTYYNIQRFFSQDHAQDIFEKIAKIPFNLIISVSPDLLLKKYFEANQIPHRFEYYRKYENPKDVELPTIDMPLIYNLFGSIEDDESMIFTHDDLFDFIFALLGDHHLPNNIENELKTGKNFIFLGFKFDKWYVKLLLRLINSYSNRLLLRYASNLKGSINDYVKEFCKEQFKINFIEEDINGFIVELHKRCEQQNLTRQGGTALKAVSIYELVQNYIKNDELEQALEKMNVYLQTKPDETELMDDLTLLMSRFNRLKRKMTNNLVTPQDAEVPLNNIKQEMLTFAEQLSKV